jgi:energy-converting hydrogenase Eha subunit C
MPVPPNKLSNFKIVSYFMLAVAVVVWIIGTNYILDLRNQFRGTIALLELQLGFVLPIVSKFWLNIPRNVLFFSTVLVIVLLVWKEFRGYPDKKTLSLNLFAIALAAIGVLFADYSLRLPLNSVFQQFSK